MPKTKTSPFKKVVVEIPDDMYNDLLELKPADMFRKSFFKTIFMAGTYIYLDHVSTKRGKK